MQHIVVFGYSVMQHKKMGSPVYARRSCRFVAFLALGDKRERTLRCERQVSSAMLSPSSAQVVALVAPWASGMKMEIAWNQACLCSEEGGK